MVYGSGAGGSSGDEEAASGACEELLELPGTADDETGLPGTADAAPPEAAGAALVPQAARDSSMENDKSEVSNRRMGKPFLSANFTGKQKIRHNKQFFAFIFLLYQPCAGKKPQNGYKAGN